MEETDETEHATSRINVGSTVFSHLSNFYNSIQNPEGQMSDCCAKKNFYHIKQRQLNPKPIFWRRIQFFEDSQSISELTVLKTPSEIERQKFVAFEKNAIYYENDVEFEKTPSEVNEARIEKKFKKAYTQSFVAFNQFQHLNFCKKVAGSKEISPTTEPDPQEEHADKTKLIRQEESERGMFFSKKLFYTPRFQSQRRQQWREMATGLEDKRTQTVINQEKNKENESEEMTENNQENGKPVLEAMGIHTYKNVINNPDNTSPVRYRAESLRDKLKKVVDSVQKKKRVEIETES